VIAQLPNTTPGVTIAMQTKRESKRCDSGTRAVAAICKTSGSKIGGSKIGKKKIDGKNLDKKIGGKT
jgi:hypothetical protein